MAGYRNPMRAAEPYEVSQGGESATETSPEALNTFYQEMERKETLERKLSKRNSGKSIWSRKSVKRSTTAPLDPVAPSFTDRSPRPEPSSSGHGTEHIGYDGDDQMEKVDDNKETDFRPQMSSPRSIIPDAVKELPASYKDAWASVPLPSFTVRYNLHNPRGPRWYKNHHLLHPSQVRPSVRPPTFFSPSFPPISTSSAPEHIYDATDLAGPSRTPSNSPLPTPDSSQTRVADGGKSRSRKTSQTTPDNVDLLDVTDPWGTNWHHHSPYDYGYGTSTSPEVYDPPNRPRRASFQGHHKSVIPSPLSQSTSAVHLQASNVVGAHIPRKLSKRRTPVGHIFGAPKDLDRKAHSAPVTPLDIPPTSHLPGPLGVDAASKRMSTAPTVGPPPTLNSKKEKRISVLGRLVRKFSILRKSQDDQQVNEMQNSWHHVDVQDVHSETHYNVLQGRNSPEKLSKRVPPPSAHAASPQDIPRAHGQADRSSSISLETPITTGKLTIANPDALESPIAPSFSSQESPLPPLPPEKPRDVVWAPNLDLHSPPQLSLYFAPLISSSPGLQPLSYDTPEDKSSIPTPSFSSTSVMLSPSVNHDTPRQLPSEVLSPSMPTSPMQPTSSHAEIQSIRSQLRETHDHSGAKSPRLPVASPHAGTGATYAQHPSQGTERQPVSQNKPSPTHSQPEVRHSRVSNRSLDNRSLDKQQSPISQTLMPEYSPAHVPFPTVEVLAPPPKLHSFASYHDSPLSTSSMLVNPPTPYDPPAKLSTPESLPSHPPLKVSTSEVKRSSHELSPLSPSGRQTETFKLIRSLSGNVYASSETIVAAGQQWEVVESKDKGKSPKSKDKDASLRRPPEDGSNRRDDGRRSHVELEGGSNRREEGHSSRREDTHSSRKEEGHSRKEEGHSSRNKEGHSGRSKEGHSRKEEGHSRKEEGHSRKEEGHSRKEEGHSRKEEGQNRKEEGHSGRSKEGHSRKEEGHSRKEEGHSRKEEGHDSRREHEPSTSRKLEGGNHKQPEGNSRLDPGGSKYREQEASSSRRERERGSGLKEREGITDRKVPEGRSSRKEQDSGSYRKEKEKEASSKKEGRTSRRDDDGHNRKEEPSSGRKDHRRDSKAKVEPEVEVDYRYKEHSNRAHKQQLQEPKPNSSKPLSTGRNESDHREPPHTDEHRSSRRRDDTRDRRSERRATEPVYDKPQPPQPEEPVPRSLERHPSTSARPTSELPSAAELNAMRAKEAWDMERLWKARSLNGSDMPTNSIPAYSMGSASDLAASQSAVYGSSHTAFVVQTPFQGHAPQIYHSMPTAPPPFIYSPSSFPTIHGSASSFDSPIIQGPHLNYLNSNPRPISSLSRPTLNNPLPAPPQESPYEPALLQSIPPSRRSADYWTKHAGITTAH